MGKFNLQNQNYIIVIFKMVFYEPGWMDQNGKIFTSKTRWNTFSLKNLSTHI